MSILSFDYKYTSPPAEVTCHSCETTRDTRKEVYCKKCMRMFDCRTLPDRMLHSERIQEAQFILDNLVETDLPYDLKCRRLSELAGRRAEEGEPLNSLVKDIIKQDKYPGMPSYPKQEKKCKHHTYILKSQDYELTPGTFVIIWTPGEHDYIDITKEVFDLDDNGMTFEGTSDYLACDSILEEWDDCVPY